MSAAAAPPVRMHHLLAMKQRGEKIAALTAYDASFAHVLDLAGIDVILVGDTLGMVVQGEATTLPVTIEHMVYHTRCVAQGIKRALLIADLPFLSYATPEQALLGAHRLMGEGYAHAVKLEGGARFVDTVRLLTGLGVPVCGHLGILPQSIHHLGGYRVQGREPSAAEALLRDALALQQAGCSLLVLEGVPQAVARELTTRLAIPTIGIGAGRDCDGQILVLYDMLDIYPGKRPRFSHNFMAGADSIQGAVREYIDAVRSGAFPGPEHTFS